ncbi:MAG: bifunctional aspartate kinase/homoserine dehydrogenase I [Chitinophagaceae bacterium]|nr:bifunctional aspartate kinase/homoserine dehydrogenase I [Chitinophagaceae bacterium]
MQVLKFGGTSVANADNINKVVAITQSALMRGRTVIVVSAFGGITDTLLAAGQQASIGDDAYKQKLLEIEQRHLDAVKLLVPVTRQSAVLSLVKKYCNEIEDICNGVFLLRELSLQTKDRVMSYGEILSSIIIAHRFNELGIVAEWKDARELIVTDSAFGNAAVDFVITQEGIKSYFKQSASTLFVIPGFVAANSAGVTTTLGRGGSDYTAAIIGAAVDATAVEIWTDVSGMMTADPRLVANARIIPDISYQEAMELSHFGAKVIYPPTIQPVMKKNIPVWIKNTFVPEDYGTLIQKDVKKNGSSVRGISSMNKIALLSLEGSGMVGIPGFSKRLFEALANATINVILITQSSSEHSICVAVDEANAQRAKVIVDKVFAYEIEISKVEPLVIEADQSILALVGDNMKSHPGIAGKMFNVLGKNGVNIRAIAQGSSERNISAVISLRDVRKAINSLHEEFFETSNRQLNLFVVGVGNVGSKLLAQLSQQREYLQEHLRLQVNLTGIANSKKMIFSNEGIDPSKWKSILAEGEEMKLDVFVEAVRNKNLRNSVFVDITANDAVAAVYDQLLVKSISVVACNKVAASSAYSNYKKLKDQAREFNCQFLFETNVGAGLPVIGTLNDLLRTGDKVNRIEAVLSGTLNFVFNNYDGTKKFSEVVRQAQEEGYTEPDPRLDLSGTDVMRKIMILARESGETIEMNSITNNSFLPESCMKGSVADFYVAMEKEEAHFRSLYDKAAAAGKKLKFVASFERNAAGEGVAAVGLQHIGPEHNLYHLYGKDNIVLFYTDRYPQQPLVVKGAGAGAEVTASGVFADIMRAVNP